MAVPEMVSPTITGFFHLRSEKPRPPIEAMVLRKASPSMRSVSAAVCQPEEARPPSSEAFAAVLVEMEREGVELAGEGDDHVLADAGGAEVDDLTDGEVLVVAAVLR